MEKVCPACNGMLSMKEICPNCRTTLEDGGRTDSYMAPYSPYYPDVDNLSSSYTSEQPSYCVHLFFCPKCGTQHKKGICYVAQ